MFAAVVMFSGFEFLSFTNDYTLTWSDAFATSQNKADHALRHLTHNVRHRCREAPSDRRCRPVRSLRAEKEKVSKAGKAAHLNGMPRQGIQESWDLLKLSPLPTLVHWDAAPDRRLN